MASTKLALILPHRLKNLPLLLTGRSGFFTLFESKNHGGKLKALALD